MTVRPALTSPAFKRAIALTAAYVLVLQALFGAGSQLRVALAQTPGLCTILGFQEPGAPKHALDSCTVHCAGHAAQDGAGLAAVAALLAIFAMSLARPLSRAEQPIPAYRRAFWGRAPPD